MSQVEVVESTRDVLSKIGLGTPTARAFVAGVAVTSVLYLAGCPKAAFDEDGNIRAFAPLSEGPDAVTLKHFLCIPCAVTAAVFLFT